MRKFFGTDGIRGTVGEWPLVPEFCLRLGQAAGAVLGSGARGTTILLGRDTRLSGPMLQSALTSGLLNSGVNVIDVGVIPTPGVSWLLCSLGANAGVVLSASHNPWEQNGIKFFGSSGGKLSQNTELEIERLLDSLTDRAEAGVTKTGGIGRLIDGRFLQERYIGDLLAEHPDLSLESLAMVIDCANGAASDLAPQVFGHLGARTFVINASPNGRNINVAAGSEHVRRQIEDITLLIKQYKAHFGLAFDGDADRVVFVDETGNLIDGDHMLGILASYLDGQGNLLARSVVTTTMRNSGLKTYFGKSNIHLYETPVGDKYVVEKLLELREESPGSNALGLGGEQAGHIVLIDDEHATGDGLRTALFVIQSFLESGMDSLSQLGTSIGKVPQIIASAHVSHGARYSREQLDEIEAQTSGNFPGIIRINLRYSGTEPLFRVMLESDGELSEDDLARIATGICREAQAFADEHDAPIDILNSTRGGTLPPR